MKYFTDEKFESNTAHSEYEEYCRAIWDKLPEELRMINGGMLPKEMMLGSSIIELHDATITDFQFNGSDLVVHLNADNMGALRKVKLKYENAELVEKPKSEVLGGQPDHPDSDVMCHEIELLSNCRYLHSLLFASNEELIVDFFNLSVSYEDVL